jgi:hypothetical protein
MGINIYRIYNAGDVLPGNIEPPRWNVDFTKCIVEFVISPTDGLPTYTKEQATTITTADEWQPATNAYGDEVDN